MPIAAALPFILAGTGALGGALSGSKGARTSTSSTVPTMDPAYSPIQQKLIDMIMGNLNTGGLPAGFEEQGISGINDTYKNITQSIGNKLASQGLTGSPVAGNAMATTELNRAGDVSRWETSLPTVARLFQNQDMSQAMQLLGLGKGFNTTSVGAGSQAGSALAGSGVGTMLGYLTSKGKFGDGGGVDWDSVLKGINLDG